LGNNRGLALGHVFSEDGLLVATVAQEALIRDLTPST
jgi:acyl-CoA thioesterase